MPGNGWSSATGNGGTRTQRLKPTDATNAPSHLTATGRFACPDTDHRGEEVTHPWADPSLTQTGERYAATTPRA